MDEGTPRTYLLHHLRHVAGQRDQQARDWPQDAAKCENSAASLRSLARYIEMLPGDDDALAVLDMLFPDGDFWEVVNTLKSHDSVTGAPGQAPAHRISRYGRSSVKLHDWEHRQFLSELLHELAGQPERIPAAR